MAEGVGFEICELTPLFGGSNPPLPANTKVAGGHQNRLRNPDSAKNGRFFTVPNTILLGDRETTTTSRAIWGTYIFCRAGQNLPIGQKRGQGRPSDTSDPVQVQFSLAEFHYGRPDEEIGRDLSPDAAKPPTVELRVCIVGEKTVPKVYDLIERGRAKAEGITLPKKGAKTATTDDQEGA